MTDTPDAQPELLPCPFCGKALIFKPSHLGGRDYYEHRCLAAPVQPKKHEDKGHLAAPSGLHGQELPLEPGTTLAAMTQPGGEK